MELADLIPAIRTEFGVPEDFWEDGSLGALLLFIDPDSEGDQIELLGFVLIRLCELSSTDRFEFFFNLNFLADYFESALTQRLYPRELKNLDKVVGRAYLALVERLTETQRETLTRWFELVIAFGNEEKFVEEDLTILHDIHFWLSGELDHLT